MSLVMTVNHDYLHSFIPLLDSLSEPWGIKDLASRHVYMNTRAYSYTNTPTNFDIEGKSDEEFPIGWAELSDDFIEHDHRTETCAERVTVIETHYWFGKAELAPFISEKIPLFNPAKECVGILWNARPMTTLSPLIHIDRRKPTVLKTEITTDLFTRAELDTLFLVLRRFSSKEIAKRFNLSSRTIENRIQSMYQKAGVHSFNQFEEFCYQQGLDGFIPHSLLTKGILFI
ncbi:LuxR family transcriptional regulator [Dickeya dianthicola]|uniref:Helix-turn-helix transcriptional regulator n=1 Tax=Dickeya dianthicola TaxID=204039 RepID=A0AAP6S2N8_9GAMM|nr:LuxR C-terminal-related transcriptional regulator [Dickeya dianthicola]MBI0436558.1 LuxR family transcriptional regulator [Dickeya dianthicola]MBI0449378.1 LuxR family transcriptional regulator [Dickeya dianthicola]MBI0454050.1 LuxR family transcriptional regulator [Dickeya dianthicola]MBI0458230.1 LuxR family transcriptional regulator [Dickeya dianthicola]MBI0463000.1 LuxR family transcriptional regulator [Dickeya dianthicola]